MVPRCGKQSGRFLNQGVCLSFLSLLSHIFLSPHFLSIFIWSETPWKCLLCKQGNNQMGLLILKWEENTCQFMDLPFFEWIRVSNHKKQWLTKINSERLIVSWVNAYAVLFVECNARSTKSHKWLQ